MANERLKNVRASGILFVLFRKEYTITIIPVCSPMTTEIRKKILLKSKPESILKIGKFVSGELILNIAKINTLGLNLIYFEIILSVFGQMMRH